MAALIPQAPDDFPDIATGFIEAANDFFRGVIVGSGDFFEAISNALNEPLLSFERFLLGLPPWVVLAVVGLIALAVSRRPVLALLLVAGTYLLGALQLWAEAMQTLSMMMVAIVLAVIIGIPLGVLTARSDRFKAIFSPILDVMQTIPSFV